MTPGGSCVFLFFFNPEKVTVVVMTTEVLEDGSGSLHGSMVQRTHQGCSVCGLRPGYLGPGSVGLSPEPQLPARWLYT